jgi:hypothetical protein
MTSTIWSDHIKNICNWYTMEAQLFSVIPLDIPTMGDIGILRLIFNLALSAPQYALFATPSTKPPSAKG